MVCLLCFDLACLVLCCLCSVVFWFIRLMFILLFVWVCVSVCLGIACFDVLTFWIALGTRWVSGVWMFNDLDSICLLGCYSCCFVFLV